MMFVLPMLTSMTNWHIMGGEGIRLMRDLVLRAFHTMSVKPHLTNSMMMIISRCSVRYLRGKGESMQMLNRVDL